MMNSYKWVLLGVCAIGLSGCGGSSDDNKSTVEIKVAPVPHISAESSQANIIKQGIVLPQPGIYQTALLTRGNTQKIIDNIDGLAIVYPRGERALRWDVLADNGDLATWWIGRAEVLPGSETPSALSLARISRKTDAGNFVMIKGDDGAQLQPSPYQMTSNTPTQVLIRSQQVIKSDGTTVRYSAFDFSSTGTSFYHNWSGDIAITPVENTNIKNNAWGNKTGHATEMLGNLDVTNNGGKLTVSMELPSAGCTVIGEGDVDASKPLSKLAFTGFEKCKFVEPDDASWSQSDYKNTAGLAKVKDTATAYIAEFNDARNSDMLVIGFPELNGVVFKLANK